MPSDPSIPRWLLGLLTPVATLLTPYSQMREESEFPVTLALSPEKEVCLQEGPGIFCVKLGKQSLPGAGCPRSAGGLTVAWSWPSHQLSLSLCVLHWALNEHWASSKEPLTLLLDSHWSCVGEIQIRYKEGLPGGTSWRPILQGFWGKGDARATLTLWGGFPNHISRMW